ncbi:uncharacterized protein TNCV_3243331 [Trichonephila clavipes]|nr:uncharacterized protein TNCV_3243331 [Trichonephila clavipes]
MRLTWAREHSLCNIKDWKKVIFSDESQFCISGNHSSAYVRRRTHEEFSPQCLKPTVKYHPTKVMVWGCMPSHSVGRLHIVSETVKAMDYIEILQKNYYQLRQIFLGISHGFFRTITPSSSCKDESDVEIVLYHQIVPPDVSELTDEDEGDENEVNTGEIIVNDVPGCLEGESTASDLLKQMQTALKGKTPIELLEQFYFGEV